MHAAARSVSLAELTWPEAQAAFADAEVVLIPLGSNEQRGLRIGPLPGWQWGRKLAPVAVSCAVAARR